MGIRNHLPFKGSRLARSPGLGSCPATSGRIARHTRKLAHSCARLPDWCGNALAAVSALPPDPAVSDKPSPRRPVGKRAGTAAPPVSNPYWDRAAGALSQLQVAAHPAEPLGAASRIAKSLAGSTGTASAASPRNRWSPRELVAADPHRRERFLRRQLFAPSPCGPPRPAAGTPARSAHTGR